ncbi:MAG: (Fe-S)-binding protein [Myxococcales bacterium]|nr:(Fe-S)-binding protein [Myxococcales bacterium]
MKGARDQEGAAAAARQLDSHERALEYCTFCPKLCRHSCPVAVGTSRETLIPQAKMQILQALRVGDLPWRQSYVEVLYGCAGCTRCREYCDHENDVASALFEGRAVARQRGVGHPALEELPDRWRAQNAKLAQTLRDDDRLAFATSGELGYLPAPQLIERGLAGAMSDVMSRADVVLPIVADPPSFDAAYALWAGGFVDSARLAGEELLRRLRGFRAVVCDDAHAVSALSVWLPEHGISHNLEVLHSSELLARHVEQLPVKRRRARAFYHDACGIGRGLRCYEPPRAVVARCVDELGELYHSRELSDCCAAAGLVPLTFPEATTRASAHIADEVALYQGDVLVSASPRCAAALRASAPSTVEVLDLVELARWACQAS